ncbi:ATP-binding protein [Flavobacterium suzhouense]|uniref:histidine kinase n=1 Tax=Flavobacterium suzhouense TaxID=1529638 RepID=A0ABW5NXW6_9FLAO
MFKPFVRLHSKSKYEGNGLGLALCKRIVGWHNGTIEAVSRSSGAEFVICLPLEKTAKSI